MKSKISIGLVCFGLALSGDAFAKACKPLNKNSVEPTLAKIFDSPKVKNRGGTMTKGVSRTVGSHNKGYISFFAIQWRDYAGNGSEAKAYIECNDGVWQINSIWNSARGLDDLYVTVPY